MVMASPGLIISWHTGHTELYFAVSLPFLRRLEENTVRLALGKSSASEPDVPLEFRTRSGMFGSVSLPLPIGTAMGTSSDSSVVSAVMSTTRGGLVWRMRPAVGVAECCTSCAIGTPK